jgi:hypothetical protein
MVPLSGIGTSSALETPTLERLAASSAGSAACPVSRGFDPEAVRKAQRLGEQSDGVPTLDAVFRLDEVLQPEDPSSLIHGDWGIGVRRLPAVEGELIDVRGAWA